MANYQTPGVYVVEKNAFPSSIAEVPTAIPGFVGYTPRASYRGKSYTNKPVQINSLMEFLIYFGVNDPANPAPPPPPLPPEYSPLYYFNEQKTPPPNDYISIAGKYYTVDPDPGTVYYLYNSIRMFYENGGGTCYVVSVGPYGAPTGKSLQNGQELVNNNVQLADLTKGLDALKKIEEVTMLVMPDALLMNEANYSTMMGQMLTQANTLQNRFCIFDVQGGDHPDPLQYDKLIETFRTKVGENYLKFGAAYFPFLETSLVQNSEINYTNIANFAKVVEPLLKADPNASPAVSTILGNISSTTDPTPAKALSLENALFNASNMYGHIKEAVLKEVNIQPTSPTMAGIYTATDNNIGVWKAPANVSILEAVAPTLKLTSAEQASLNVDPSTGKSVNAIRFFPGEGVLVWGARTLDGNSQDWRYINVKRTLIMIEQSVKLSAKQYVFAPNTSNTWALVKASISNFLTTLWREGALVGPKPADAFQVSVGLGTTMTAQDILNGFMRVTVKVAVSHPAEFIVITFQQEQQQG
ncbi:MAG: phage tail sheath C-terminal domain-containing protein [Bacteroidota bacterium]